MSSISNARTAHRSIAMTTHVEALRQWWPLLLRLIVGYGFIVHGYAKLSRGPETFAAVLHTLHVPLPLLAAWSTTMVELVWRLCDSDRRLCATGERADGGSAFNSAVQPCTCPMVFSP